jgi:hypothetical protein
MTDRKETGRFIQNVDSQFITKFVSRQADFNQVGPCQQSFQGAKRPRRGVDPHPHLAPRLRKSRAIPLHPSGPSWPAPG